MATKVATGDPRTLLNRASERVRSFIGIEEDKKGASMVNGDVRVNQSLALIL